MATSRIDVSFATHANYPKSCNTILWGDFLVDDDHDLDQLKRELVCWNVLPIHKLPSDTLASEPIANSTAEIPGTIEPGSTHAREPLQELEAAGLATSNSQNSTTVASSSSGATHVVEINFAPKYFEVCTNVGNYTVDHQELDISRVVSDNELFEMILDKYNSSRGLGLRRIFLRPKDVHFVMVFILLILGIGLPSTENYAVFSQPLCPVRSRDPQKA